MNITGFNDNYFSGQGDVFIARRDAGGNPGAFYPLGNTTKLSVALSAEKREHQESRSGNRLVDKVSTTKRGGKVSLTLEDVGLKIMARLLQGAIVSIASGSFASSNYDTFPLGLAVNDIVKLAYQNVSTVVIKDSAGTPATLTAGTHYKILDAKAGLIQILNLGSLTQPFKAQYTYAATQVVTAFADGEADAEFYLYAPLLNTERSPFQQVAAEVYRVRFDAAGVLDLINAEQASFDIEGDIMRDAVRAADANYGGFLRWNPIDANL